MPKALMQLLYVGPSRKTMGITARGTNTTYQFTPGEPFSVLPEDGAAILAAHKALFEEVKPKLTSSPARETTRSEDTPLDGKG